jgi:mannitol/fructose-specific phosphotransferase system IIA component (Ntr-type)
MTPPGQPVPFLADMLTSGAIKLHLASTKREDVLAELVDEIREISGNPETKRNLVHALIEREDLHSTGIGDGVALPHARNALVGLVDHPILVFGRSDQGIPFAALDGSPARLFFLIVAPTVTQHLSLLARLSRLLRDPKVRKELLAATSADEIRTSLRHAEEQLRA